MNSNTLLEWQCVGITIILTAGLFAVASQRDSLKQEAVDRGFAEWHIVAGTKEVEFKWKENK